MSGLIEPVLRDDAFLADVERARTQEPARLHLWWLGQSGYLIHWGGRFLLLDPYLSDSLTRKYAATDKPHERMTARVVAPERLGFVDLATSSHNHTDHLDGETLRPLRAANAGLWLVIPEANRRFVAERLGTPVEWPLGLEAGGTIEHAGFRLRAVPAAHESLDRDAAGRHLYLGYVIQAGPWTIYHSGDTVRYEGQEEWIGRPGPDVVLLPINGRAPERRVAGNLWGREAAALAHALGAGVAIPCHYEMFRFNTATPEEFRAECERLGQRQVILQAGERWSAE